VSATHYTLGLIAGALVVTLIVIFVRRAFSGRPAGGGGGGQNQQPQQPANPVAAAQPAQPRDWGFWTLLIISISGIIAAVFMVKQVQTGAMAVVGVTMSSTALVLGITLAIVAMFWFNAIGGWPARKIWGTITATFAVVLLTVASWDLFLRDWCKQMTTSTSPIKEDELVHFFSQNHVGVIAVASVLFLIALWKSKGFQKFAGVAGIVALIGWVGVWGVREIAIALENGGETRSSLIKTVPGSMQITIGTKGFTEICYPEGYNWDQAVYGAKGEGYKRPVTIIAVKNGVRKVFGPNDDPCLHGLPIGREPTLIKAVAPADIEGNPTFVLTVVTFKVPSERR
jgi:hypothetical protein